MTAYAETFGLTGRPFRLEPDPDLFFDCRAQREALARLTDALSAPDQEAEAGDPSESTFSD